MQQFSIREIFPGLEEELYLEMERAGEVREIPAGATLLRKGQVIRSTMLILDGIVKLYQEDEDGSEFFMYTIEPGQACAISMVCTFGQENSQISAKALTAVTVLVIPIEYMDQWLMQYKSWYQFVIRTWRARHEDLLHTVNAIAFKHMDERLEHYILAHVKRVGRRIQLTHQEIATDLNSSREVISRLMKKMEKDGWIAMHRNGFEWLKA